MVEVVGQLIEFAQAPGGQGRPAARTRGRRLVVELLSIAHEEVYQQKDQQERRQQQVSSRNAPVTNQETDSTLTHLLRPRSSSLPGLSDTLLASIPCNSETSYLMSHESAYARWAACLNRRCSLGTSCLNSSLMQKLSSSMASRMHQCRFHSSVLVSMKRLPKPGMVTFKASTPCHPPQN